MAVRHDTGPEEPTQVLVEQRDGDEWPVSDLYRVDAADEDRGAPTHDERATVVSVVAEDGDRRRRLPVEPGLGVLVAIAVAIAGIGLGAWLLTRDEGDDPGVTPTVATAPVDAAQAGETPTTPTSAQRKVPKVVGVTVAEARSVLEDAGYRVRSRSQESTQPAGEVLGQNPSAGAELAPGSIVTLTVARRSEASAERVTAPEVVGRRVSAASTMLRRAGLRVQIELVPSQKPAGTVLTQSPPAGSEVAEQSLVTLEVAAARRADVVKIELPDVVGATAADARRQLRERGLEVEIERVAAQEDAGTVVRQSPAAGSQVREGATVVLRVSTGPPLATVPDVTGLDEAAARLELERAGFVVRVMHESTSDPEQDGLVVGQSPLGGSSTSDDAVVTITVARLD